MTTAKSDSIRSILKRVYRLLNHEERKRSMLLLLSIFANSIVEILGLAVIVPVIGLVIQPETIQTSATLRTLYEAVAPFGINTPSRFLIALCFILIGAFLFKALFGLAVNLFQTRFSFTVAHRLSGQMWSYHFSKSLERMRGTNSGRVLAEINTWPLNFATSFMVGGLMILTEVSVISLIATGLLFYNSVVFLSITGLLAIGAFIIRKVTKQRLGVYSATRQKVEPRTNTLITNAVRGFLEVITFRASDAVRNAYLKDRWTILRIVSNTSVLALSPSKLYEVLAVIAVAGSIIIALLQGTPEASFLQLLSFMAISAYRIMPSMSRLNSVIIRMREQQHVLETMEVGAQTNADNSASNQSPINSVANSQNQNIDIELNDITLSYEALQKPVIEHLQHTFSAAGLHAIVGPSGSGKSTLVSSILGLHKAKNGHVQMRVATNDVQILGADIDLHSWILNVGYLSQQPFLFAGSVRDNLTLRVPGATVNEDLVDLLIQQLSLEECLGSNPLEFQIQEGGSNLSGGQQQRLALLRALQIQRPVLILDEATSALDHALRNVVFELLRKRADDGCNIILVTHDKALASKCDDVLDLGGTNES
ncbi:ABC transporter ATP-binding protein/permease [Flavobacteriales bacterium]|nr:ABC transporter ATP-binding protein/permease [Flavobacteriales bacterium]